MKKLFFYTLLVVFTCPFLVSAQTAGIEPELNIITSPNYPEPNKEFEVRLDAYTSETYGATIKWYVDGVEKTEVANQRTFELINKKLGETTKINAVLTNINGQSFSVIKVITPARLDLVLEADTTVPHFYKGRPLPSTGSKVRIIATPYTTSDISPENFTYVWKQENKVLFGGPVRGMFVAEVDMSMHREQLLSVTVLDTNNQPVISKTILLDVTEPEVVFYEESPLRGMSRQALSKDYYLISDESTLRAEPYYMDQNIFNQNPLLEWKINGRTTDNPNSDPQNLTLRREQGGGSARIGFEIRNLTNLLQGAEGIINIIF